MSFGLADHIVQLYMSVHDLQRRVATGMRHGMVAEVDTARQRARVRIGGTDDAPYLSPWLPYGQQAAPDQGLKLHMPVAVGQNVTIDAPGGDLRQGRILPFTWSDQAPAPGQGADPVLTYGALRVEVGPDRVVATLGEARLELTAEAFEMTAKTVRAIGSHLRHNDRNVGDSHRHDGVDRGNAETNPPVDE